MTMKIVYLHQYFKTPAEAGGCRSYEFARRLAERGHQVDMVTSIRDPKVDEHGWQECSVDGIRVHAIPVPYANAMPYKQRIVAFLRFAYRAARRGALLSPDVVFATSTPLTIALPGVYAARRRRVPMVFEVRDLWPELPVAVGALNGRLPVAAARWLERFAYRNSERIVALSPGMKDGILRSGYPRERIHVIPNCADLDLFDVPLSVGEAFRAQLDWLHDRPLVVYAGTIGLINGVDYLVRLAAVVREMDPDVRFLVIGKGKREQYVRELAGELGILGKSLFLMAPIPRLEMPKVLSAADIATSVVIDLPELWMNSANKFFDALASGTPVAINHGGWQADLLDEAAAGIVLDVQDLQRSAQQLVQALHDLGWLERAGSAARRLAEERFSRDALAEELEDVLLEATRLSLHVS